MSSTELTDRPEAKAASGCPVDHAALLAHGSLKDPDISAHPQPYYDAMRAEDPVHFDEKLNAWLVSRYEDLQTVLRDPITYSVQHGYAEQYARGFHDEFKAILARDGGGYFPDAIMSDPPYHTRVRRLMEKAFTAHRVKTLEPAIGKLVGDMVEELSKKTQIDGVADLAQPITIAVICEQLGIDQFDSGNIQRWSHAVVQQIGGMQSREQMLGYAQEICELQNFLIGHMRDREKTPREDMISDIVHAKLDDGTTLTFEEAVSLVRALLIAGNETTATALANLLLLLATQPEVARQLKEVAEDDRMLTRFVEELLRIEAPVRGLSRSTIKEVELGGVTLPKGAHMLLMYASGNDDEREFANPRTFDLNRGNLGRHLAFGAGVHRCVGLALARMEVKVAAREIARRLDKVELTIPLEEVAYLPTVATHSIAKLPLKLTPRAA